VVLRYDVAKTLCYNRAPFDGTVVFQLSFYFPLVPAALAQRPAPGAAQNPGGKMTFNETLYARDDEMDEFGDSGAYGDPLEEDYEEEEEEEEAEVAGVIEPQPEPVTPTPAAPKPSGGGGSPKPPRKPAAKKPAKKKPARKVAKKKPAKKKPARKPAKKKVAKKRPARKAAKSVRRKAKRGRR
jgi:outer membrane biosynthesis protein TonB